MMIKESIHYEDIILNAYASNNKISKYKKEKLIELRGVMNKSIIIAKDFNNLSQITDKRSRQKISKDI